MSHKSVHPKVAIDIDLFLALSYDKKNIFPESEKYFKRVIFELIKKIDSTDLGWPLILAQTYSTLGRLYDKFKKYELAVASFDQSIKILIDKFPKNTKDKATVKSLRDSSFKKRSKK